MALPARRTRTTPRRRQPARTTSRRNDQHAAFHGDGSTLFGIRIVNLFLAVVTLGVYWFWGKARTRRYLWSQSSFAGDRFSYHGTGMEALRGWIKAAGIFGIPYLLLTYAPAWIKLGLIERTVCGLLASVVVFSFFPVAIAGARRYRLSRTAWRGIRFSFRGETWDFVRLYWRGMILTTLTLGLYYPEFAVQRTRFLIDQTWLGNRKFSFDGEAGELKPMFWKALGGSVVGLALAGLAVAGLAGFLFALQKATGIDTDAYWRTILSAVISGLLFLSGLILPWLWYGMAEKRFIWNHTKLGRARFHSSLTFRAYAKLLTGNALLLLGTLGLASPWVSVRTLRFHLERIVHVGPLGAGRIAQQARDTDATGEETGDLFDIDIELG